MIFDELFMLLWYLAPEERQWLAMRLLNYLGPATTEIPSDFAGEEKFDRIVAYFAPYPDEGVRARGIYELLLYLVKDHQVWVYGNIAIKTTGEEDEPD